MKRGFWVVLTLLAVVLGSTVVGAASGWGSFKGFPVVRLLIDGQEVVSDVPAVNFYGRTLVPLRVVSERLGASVSWDAATQTASVTAPKPAPLYSTWGLSEVEVQDALKWARAGKGLGSYGDLLPMYSVNVAENVGIDFLTPWAVVVASAQDVYKSNLPVTETAAEFAAENANQVWVKVYVWETSLAPVVSATLSQGDATYEPVSVPELLPLSDDPGVLANFVFDATPLDRAGYVTVKVVIDGQEYVYSWDLSTLK